MTTPTQDRTRGCGCTSSWCSSRRWAIASTAPPWRRMAARQTGVGPRRSSRLPAVATPPGTLAGGGHLVLPGEPGHPRRVHSRPRQGRPDAVYIHTQVASLFVVDVMRVVPAIISTDATPMNYDGLGEGYGHRHQGAALEGAKLLLNQRALRSARAVVAFSAGRPTQWSTTTGSPRTASQVIPSGVDLDVFGPGEGARGPGPVRVLFVGGDFVRKGGADLLEAVNRLGPLVEVDVVTAEAPAQLPAGVTVRVHAGLRPESPELAALYRRSDVFCFPTLGDCSPRVVAEAMASGLPVVATEVGGIREMVVDGHSGLLVPVRSTGRLAEALGRLAVRPEERHAMGDAGLRLARAHHDAARNAELLFDLMRRCSSGAGPGRPAAPPRASELVP